jgi:hypothetical protein
MILIFIKILRRWWNHDKLALELFLFNFLFFLLFKLIFFDLNFILFILALMNHISESFENQPINESIWQQFPLNLLLQRRNQLTE